MSVDHSRLRLLPGLALCAGVAAVAVVIERLERAATGQAWLEALVLAILIGTAIRTVWRPPARYEPGIHCAAKTVLEAAVMLMGATISFGAVVAAGLPLLAGIVATVFVAIGASFLLGRVLGLPHRMALLVACGNAICGNSAIAAVAPVIDADSDDVATSIAFTAVLGVGVVLALPLISQGLRLSPVAGGALAGLTVYAVPQVLAAAAPMGPTAVQLGTLVKLVRVLMLGPVVAGLSLAKARRGHRHAIGHLLPGFIVVFLALASARSLGLLPDAVIGPAHVGSNVLTIVAMAGLGLGVDLRNVFAAGPRVTIAVTLSLVVLGVVSLGVLRLAGIA